MMKLLQSQLKRTSEEGFYPVFSTVRVTSKTLHSLMRVLLHMWLAKTFVKGRRVLESQLMSGEVLSG
eukprot:753327-Amphidinium_carterae.1